MRGRECVFGGLSTAFSYGVSSVVSVEVVEGADGDFDVREVGLGVDGDEGGGEGVAGAEVDEVACEVAVDVGLGVDVEVVEVGLRGEGDL